MTNIKT